MTIKEALIKGNELLKDITEASWLDASLLLCYSLDCEKWYLTAHDDEVLSDEKLKIYFELVQRRISGVPLQYITNHQEFMSLNFFVDESVLIPRPDTEILVEEVLRYISDFSSAKSIKVLDMCTGSGCIAVSIAKYAHNTMIKAVDISKKALDTAKRNAEALGVAQRIEFIESDLYQGIKGERFDIIVSNPPYIKTSVISSLQVEVREHEPMNALDGGQDGLDFYRAIIKDADKYLNFGGILIFEIGFEQAEEIISLVKDVGKFRNIKVLNDLGGRNRVVYMKSVI